jgi:excisionase family DNA binding protein
MHYTTTPDSSGSSLARAMLARLRKAESSSPTAVLPRLPYGERTLSTSPGAPKLLLRVEEAAHLLSISRKTVYDLLQRGELGSVKIGGCRRISLDALHVFIARLEEAA